MESVYLPIRPACQLDVSWEEIAQLLVQHDNVDVKEDTNMFNLWQFKTLEEGAEEGQRKIGEEEYERISGTVRRCANNAVGLWGLVIDYDKNITIEDAVQRLAGLEYVFYTTFKHTAENPRFRIVIPFNRIMTKAEFKLKKNSISETFIGADPASWNLSQAIYLHSGENDSFSFRSEGSFLSPDDFIDDVIVEIDSTVKEASDYTGEDDAYKKVVWDEIMSCREVRRGEGSLLGCVCKSAGFTFTEFKEVIKVVAGSDSSLRKEEAAKGIWEGLSGNAKITRDKRQKFVQNHGGKCFVKETWQDKRSELYSKYIKDTV